MARQTRSESGQAPVISKVRDHAFLLPVIGLIFLIPPVADIFQLDIRITGIPFTALYLFTLWALLIIGAWLLARKLRAEAEAENTPDPTETQEN